MSDKKKEAPEATEAKEGEATEGAEGAPKKGKKKLVFIAGGLGAVIIIVAGLFLSGMLGGKKEGAETEEHAAAAEEKGGHGGEGGHGEKGAAPAVVGPVYYELPEFLVNLSSTTTRVSFLKMSVTLELRDQAAVAIMDANKPRIQDTFNTYLRELRPSDIQGSAGILRLKTELIARLNGTIEEGVVKDILFGEIIVQ